MNLDTLKGSWREMTGKIKQKWAKLTDDDLKGVEGNVDEIKGRLRKVYGYSKEKAHQEFEDFRSSLDRQQEKKFQ